MAITVDYHVTLNSPWSYLGSRPLIEIAKARGARIDIKPTKFGPVFERTGGLPLAKRAPARRAYRLMELERWGLPLDEPIHWPERISRVGTAKVRRAARTRPN